MIFKAITTNSSEFFAQFYQQLYQMDLAGLSPAHTFGLIEANTAKQSAQIKKMQRLISSGKTIAMSAEAAGLLNTFDLSLIRAGEQSGQTSRIFELLHHFYAEKAMRCRQFRNKLILPLLILVLATFLKPLPDFIFGKMTTGEYLSTTVVALIALFLACYILVRLPNWLTQGFLKSLGLAKTIYSLQVHLPIVSSWYIPRQMIYFLHCLTLQLQSGLTAIDSIVNAQKVLNNPFLSSPLEASHSALQSGQTLAESLNLSPHISAETCQQIKVGEESGKLDTLLMHLVTHQQEKLNRQDDEIVTWLPRIIYALIAAMMIHSIFTSGAFMPPEL